MGKSYKIATCWYDRRSYLLDQIMEDENLLLAV